MKRGKDNGLLEFSECVLVAMTVFWFLTGIFGIAVTVYQLLKGDAVTIDSLLTYVGLPMSGGVLGYLLKSAVENKELIRSGNMSGGAASSDGTASGGTASSGMASSGMASTDNTASTGMASTDSTASTGMASTDSTASTGASSPDMASQDGVASQNGGS